MSAVTTPTRRRTSSGAVRVSNPSTSTEPASGESSVQMIRSVVVLPAPFGPRRPKISPDSASKRDAAQHLVLAERLLQTVDCDRRRAHLDLRRALRLRWAFALGGCGLAALAPALALAARLAGCGLASASAFGSRRAMPPRFAGLPSRPAPRPMVLDSVRWQVSHVIDRADQRRRGGAPHAAGCAPGRRTSSSRPRS